MNILYTNNSKLIKKFEKLGVQSTKSTINGQTYRGFMIDEDEEFNFNDGFLDKFSKKDYFIDDKMRF